MAKQIFKLAVECVKMLLIVSVLVLGTVGFLNELGFNEIKREKPLSAERRGEINELYNYTDRYLPTLDKHIVYEGDNIKMLGYGYAPLKDFLLVEDDDDSRKILSFDIQRDRTDWHSMEGGGFLFNASVKNDTLSGFCILLTQSGLKLIDITGVNVNSFRNGSYAYVQNAGRLLATYPVNNVYAEHHIKIEINSSEISLWDDDKLLIDQYELPERDYGYGYGPITSHASHACWQQSYFTFSNIVMETVTADQQHLKTPLQNGNKGV